MKGVVKYLILLFVSLNLGCAQERIKRKVLSESDYIAPFGENSSSWKEMFSSEKYFERLEFDKEYYFDDIGEPRTKLFIHAPRKVTRVFDLDTEYIIPDKWEGYIVKIETSADLYLYYCVVDQACEFARSVGGSYKKEVEYFFAVTPGVRLIFLIYQPARVDGLCFFDCYYQKSRFYICSDGLDHVICGSDEFSYKYPVTENAMKQYDLYYDFIINDVKQGAKLYTDELTLEIKDLRTVEYGVQKRILEQNREKKNIIFSSNLLYEIEFSFEGIIGVIDSSFGIFPVIEIFGCDKDLNCWPGIGSFEIRMGNVEKREIKGLRGKFLVPTYQRIESIVMQKVY
ncbi:MAG: hypothetical protein N2254_05885 [bacterium]|nr:hypothetical protein [bacterium]